MKTFRLIPAFFWWLGRMMPRLNWSHRINYRLYWKLAINKFGYSTAIRDAILIPRGMIQAFTTSPEENKELLANFVLKPHDFYRNKKE